MTAKQLIQALVNLHPDYQDTDLAIMFLDKKNEVGYQPLAYVGIVMINEESLPVIGTQEVALFLTKEGRTKMLKTNQPPTEADLTSPDET